MFGMNNFRILSWAFGVVGVLFAVLHNDFDSAFNCIVMQLVCSWCEYKWPNQAVDVIGNPRDKK